MKRLLFAVALVACGGHGAASFGPRRVDIPVSDGARHAKDGAATPHRQSPPPSRPAKEAPFPTVARTKLANGMGVAVVGAHALPIVQIRLLVRAGTAAAPPGVASITAEMLKDGGTTTLTSAELLRRVETLGANLDVRTDFDATVISMGVMKESLVEALGLLSHVVREPRFDEGELKKEKARATDEAEDAARSSGAWTATWIVFRELYGGEHPYGTWAPLPSHIAKITSGQLRDFHRRFYVPKAATLVLAGDVDEAAAKAAAEKAFGGWSGGEPPKVEIAPPHLPEKRRVIVAHRKKSVQSDVYVAMVAPERKSPDWAALRVANQVLGGGVASRLFADVREQRSLAYRTSSQILELAHGPEPLVAYAGTQTDKTKDAVGGLLEDIAKIAGPSPPSEGEVETARRYASDVFAIRMETIGSIADLVVVEDTFALGNGYWDAYRKELRATDARAAAAAAKKLFSAEHAIVVVAGDADVVAGPLAAFGDVMVVDPEKEFKAVKR